MRPIWEQRRYLLEKKDWCFCKRFV